MRYIDPVGKLLNHVEHLSAVRGWRTMPPINVEIDLSNRCSLGCEWCHFAYTHTRGPLAGKAAMPALNVHGGDLMDRELAIKIIDQLEMCGVKSITWTGGGEPTLHPDFDDIIRYTGITNIDQGLYTHGGHINPERAYALKNNLAWVYISLDACTREDYRQSKGVDRFENVKDGIKSLVAESGKATVGVGFLLHAANYHQVWDMLYLGRDLGVDYIQFRPVIKYDMAEPGKFVDDPAWIDNAIEILHTLEAEPDVQLDLSRFKMYMDWRGHGYNRCWWAEMQTVITPNGKVWTCVNKRQIAGAELGDLTVDTFEEILKRHKPAMVDGDCRVMCRGHIPNLALSAAFDSVSTHRNFI